MKFYETLIFVNDCEGTICLMFGKNILNVFVNTPNLSLFVLSNDKLCRLYILFLETYVNIY